LGLAQTEASAEGGACPGWGKRLPGSGTGIRRRRGSGASPWWRLVAVVVGLVGSLDGDAEVFGLVV